MFEIYEALRMLPRRRTVRVQYAVHGYMTMTVCTSYCSKCVGGQSPSRSSSSYSGGSEGAWYVSLPRARLGVMSYGPTHVLVRHKTA
jgi:hypothetical protein